MDDKDRLGQKLHDKEKAAEDLYIAEMERKRMEKARAAAVAGGLRDVCPKDGTMLLKKQEHGFTVETCPKCRGIWLEQGELEAILKKEDEALVTRWVRSLLNV